MAVDERERHELHAGLVEVLGEVRASTLMSYLPPVGWGEVATRRDLDQLAVATKRDLDQLANRWRTELYREVGGLRTEMHREIGALRTEMHDGFSRVTELVLNQTRLYFFGVLASNATLAALVFAAARYA